MSQNQGVEVWGVPLAVPQSAHLSFFNVVVCRLRGLGSRKGGSFTRRENSDLTELKIQLPPGLSGLLVPLSQKAKKEVEGLGGVLSTTPRGGREV